MKKENNIKLSDETRAEMVTALKNYYLTEKDEEIGDLAARLLLDFIVEKLAPEFYNQGVNDSYLYLQDRLEDLLSIQKR